MISIESQIQIERPAAEVFAFVADQTNAPRWQDGLAEVRTVTEGPIGVGTENVFVRQFAGRRIESRNRFTRFEPGHFVEFEVPQGWITGTASYRVDPIPSGGCRMTSRMDFRIRGPFAVFSPLLARLLARDSRADETTLKTLLESPKANLNARRGGVPDEQRVSARSDAASAPAAASVRLS